MSWSKQVALAAVLVMLAALAWLRLSPEAATRLGVPSAVVAVLGGSPRDAGKDGASRPFQGFNPADRDVLVVTAPVGSARINDRFSAIGDGEALRSVTVVPLSTGILTRINVAAGDRVKAGDVLAELDQEGEQIARDRAALALAMAAEKLDRYERLVSSRAASAVQLNEARNEHENARLALRDAELTLKRRALIAPIDGTIGLVPVDAGDYVTTQTEIATIDDRSGILVDFWVPERFAGGIRIGLPVEAVAIAMPGEVFSGVVA